jgi:hypothetical protein
MEHRLGVTFDEPMRQQALRELDQLERDGLVAPTFQDLIAPRDWLTITTRGKNALENKTLDPLDEALAAISPNLLDVRSGACSAVASSEPDAMRQAAHSARELIDQTLKLGAPDQKVKNEPWYSPDGTSQTGVTRRHRLRYLAALASAGRSENDLRIADKACELVLAVDQRLQAVSHARSTSHRVDIEDAMIVAEAALRRILLGPAP